jgi:hypothetical protein
MSTFVIVAIILPIISLLLGLAMGSYTTHSLTGELSWGFISLSFVGSLAKVFGWTVLSLCAYMLLAFLLATLTRSVAWGIGSSIGINIVEGIVIGILVTSHSWAAKIPNYLISQNINALMSFSLDNVSGGFGAFIPGELPSPTHAVATLVLYCLAFIGLSLYFFWRRDLTA